jgi:anti-sigma regulatory factor (Ser/Thr protein kinase)
MKVKDLKKSINYPSNITRAMIPPESFAHFFNEGDFNKITSFFHLDLLSMDYINGQQNISKKKIIIHSNSETFNAIIGLEQFAKMYEIPVFAIQKINGAIQELLSSIIGYTTFQQQITPIELVFSLSNNGKLIIELRYGGTAFNPFFPSNQATKKQSILEDIGSLGLHLVRKCMDSYYYQRENQLNVISMCKNRV